MDHNTPPNNETADRINKINVAICVAVDPSPIFPPTAEKISANVEVAINEILNISIAEMLYHLLPSAATSTLMNNQNHQPPTANMIAPRCHN